MKAYLLLIFLICSTFACNNNTEFKYNDKEGNIFVCYCSTKNGKKDGSSKCYDDEKRLRLEMVFSRDTLDGFWAEYYLDGNLKCELFFEKGKRKGEAFSYFENGEVEEYFYYFPHYPDKQYYKKFSLGGEILQTHLPIVTFSNKVDSMIEITVRMLYSYEPNAVSKVKIKPKNDYELFNVSSIDSLTTLLLLKPLKENKILIEGSVSEIIPAQNGVDTILGYSKFEHLYVIDEKQ